MEAFNGDVAASNWELRLSGAKELPESVCTCGSVQFSLPPRLYLPCPKSCCGLVTPRLIVTDIPVHHLNLGK